MLNPFWVCDFVYSFRSINVVSGEHVPVCPLACLVVYGGNTSCLLWFFTMFGLIHPVCVWPWHWTSRRQAACGATVDSHLCLAQRLRVVNRYFQNSCYYLYQLSEYFHKALRSGKDGDTLGRHDKIKKMDFFSFFLPKLDWMLWKGPAGDIEGCQDYDFHTVRK